ncbi:hypothetical protein B7494_g2842 [Chlorociboria aeruginascens]|nr:hypothetical protein B7494_g2842 [Chlorociboria aeruginascens]
MPTSSNPPIMDVENAHAVVTDLAVGFSSSNGLLSTCPLDSQKWHRIEKDLFLHTVEHSAWIYVERERENELTANTLVVTDIRIGELPTLKTDSHNPWESRSCGIWLRRSNYTGDSQLAVTDVDILFGADAVDPRPQWSLLSMPLSLETSPRPEVPVARLTLCRGMKKPRPIGPPQALRARADGRFKILQISDTHMVTGVGACKDAMDAHGKPLPESEADPLTIQFLEKILDLEKPDLVILTGDQLNSHVLDTQSAILKIVAPFISRSIPYAAVFGNHDDEGPYAWSRTAQMTLLQSLPFSLSQPGPPCVDGIGNYYLEIFSPVPSHHPFSTLFFLDSHGEIPSETKNPDYDSIKPSQITWFTSTSQSLRRSREDNQSHSHPTHLSLAFIHIPLPEYGDSNLIITAGHRHEPTEGPSFNSHFYDVLVQEDIVALGCGHDHVNDFCGLLPGPPQPREGDAQGGQPDKLPRKLGSNGPWLTHAGALGFGGYGSYGGTRYHRRARIWELDTKASTIMTWKRVEYDGKRRDQIVLVEGRLYLDFHNSPM